MTYDIKEHRHRYAAWAAGRAASVKGCRFSVEQAKEILEIAGLKKLICIPDNLPSSEQIDVEHRTWRNNVIKATLGMNLQFSHGVAAKLINIYLKSIFVCGGHHEHINFQALHPPIDAVLLDELEKQDLGGFRSEWARAKRVKWSKFNSEQYETVINLIRTSMQDRPMWEIEQFWRGHQTATIRSASKVMKNTGKTKSTIETCEHESIRSTFTYDGDVESGVKIDFNNGIFTISAKTIQTILEHFRGQSVLGGFSMTDPTPGGVGEYLVSLGNSLTPRHASFLCAILQNEGYATCTLKGKAVVVQFME